MMNLTIIRNSVLVTAAGMLLFAEFLHPVFHNQAIIPNLESKCFAGGAPCLEQGDTALAHSEYPCPICSSMFLKYCANDSGTAVLCAFQDAAVLPPLPDFVFVKINHPGFPRAPPVAFS